MKEPLAGSVPDAGGMYFVPAFSGLLAPHWRSDARGYVHFSSIIHFPSFSPQEMSEENCAQILFCSLMIIKYGMQGGGRHEFDHEASPLCACGP
jgi:hypothetical protein